MANTKQRSPHVRRQVLFIQGAGADVHDRWDDKLVDSLKRELGSDYDVQYPRMPNEADPHYSSWKPAIEQEIESLDEDSIVVGHSIGGSMLIKLLAESSVGQQLSALILVAAPFVGEGGWPSDELRLPRDLGNALPENVPIHVFHGLSDEEVPPQHADLYESAIQQARVHRHAGRDHQFGNDLKAVATVIKALEDR